MMDKGGYEEALRYLVARQFDIYVIQMPRPGGDRSRNRGATSSLIDVEDNDEAEITVSAPLIQRYKQNLAAYQSAIQSYCNRGASRPVHEQPGPVRPVGADLLRQRGLVR